MKNAIIATLIVGVAITLSIYCLRGSNRTLEASEAILEEGLSAEVVVTPSHVIIKEIGKAPKVVKVPRTGTNTLRKKEAEEFVVMPQAWWMPKLVALPHIGISHTCEPLLGLQVIRFEQLALGLSFNMTPSTLAVSLDRDIWSNIQGGLCYGINKEGYTRLFLKVAVYF